MTAHWQDDLLSYAEIGKSFTNLVQSIEGSKVISVEAGFGHGKTFFRKAWASQLRAANEVVIEIDAQQSDHSGEPVVTFLGALLAAAPPAGKETLARKGLKLAGVASRSIARAVLREGAEEVIGMAGDWMQGQTDIAALDKAIDELEEGMSRYARQLIANQLAAERVRQQELPEQIDLLRDALTEGAAQKRVVVLIDELDRCHPDYAIALLEAMKLVFDRPGFVFVLMVNKDYLESIADHRFGTGKTGESYLEKFVDLRLALKPTPEAIGAATAELVRRLKVEIPFGPGEAFTVEAAANLAAQIAPESDLSFRQIKRVVDRVELVARCYRQRPIDLPLLVYLAFSDMANPEQGRPLPGTDQLSRLGLTPAAALRMKEAAEAEDAVFYFMDDRRRSETERNRRRMKFVEETCPELLGLPDDRYGIIEPPKSGEWPDWYKVLAGLGPRYIPEHQAMLDAVHRLMA